MLPFDKFCKLDVPSTIVALGYVSTCGTPVNVGKYTGNVVTLKAFPDTVPTVATNRENLRISAVAFAVMPFVPLAAPVTFTRTC